MTMSVSVLGAQLESCI